MNDTNPTPQQPPDPNPTHTKGEADGAENASQASLGKAAWAIYNELAKIRMLLQHQQTQDQAGDVVHYHCSLCDDTIPSEKRAKQHAINDHGAPRSDWREVYREVPE